MGPKQYHNKAFALGITALAFLCATFSLRGQSLAERSFSRGVADSLSLSGMTSISFGDRVLLHDLQLSVASLDSASVPPMDYGMINVTVQGEGCRFLPHGIHFGGEGATVRLRYDRTRIPSGYTEDDIRTYYYDTSLERWVALERIEVDRESATVVSRTTHFTDMVNGVIMAPETPETGAFVPTMMSDIQAADPTSKLTFITPPTANNRGSANLQYPFEMPPARNGMQPSLMLTYNSDDGSGWAGEGWDLRIPAITVDTRWGVPRYSTEFESETYLLNGQMLAMMSGGSMTVAHRQDSVPRDTCRMFFVRQGGDFSKIVRHGNNPNNYWWEVTSRDGTVYTYGVADSSCVKGNYTGVDGIQREVIAEWRLNSVRETHGDRIDYIWQADTIYLYGGTFAVRDLWLSQVTAKNKEHAGPHTRVTFHNREQGKAMSANSARYGFLTASTHLLESVDVDFRAAGTGNYENLRTYSLNYRDGTFSRELLDSIAHIVSNDTVSFQSFDYYNDAKVGGNIMPYQAVPESLSAPNDHLNAGFIFPLPEIGDFSGNVTALGGSKSMNFSTSAYVGVGPYDSDMTKRNTVGIDFNFNLSNTDGVSTLVDIDGDGVLDKVFVSGGVLKYRSGITSTNAVDIIGVNRFSHTRTTTFGGGVKFFPRVYGETLSAGLDAAVTNSSTDTYFADVNGDGLVDIVRKGKVYFNTTKYVGDVLTPSFSLSSADSPSPIMASGDIDTSDTEVSEEEREEILANSPMVDMVRVWVAPYAGYVSIGGSVSLLPPQEDDDDGADGVWFSIQHENQVLLSDSIGPNDASAHIAAWQSVQVAKGDRIFFRLQSGRQLLSDGSSDRVAWRPVITYSGMPYLTTPNGHYSNRFDSRESEVVSENSVIPFRGSKDLDIIGTFEKPITSDNVTLRVFTSSERVDTAGQAKPFTRNVAYERTFAWDETFNGNLSLSIPYTSGEQNVECEVVTSSNVAWENLKWFPVLKTEKDSIGVPVSYSIFPECVYLSSPCPVTVADTLHIGLQCSFSSNESGTFCMTAKSKNRLYGKRDITVSNGVIVGGADMNIVTLYSDSIWFELFTYNPALALSIDNPDVHVSGLHTNYTNSRVTSVYTVTDEERFGQLYRGWGQFAYNTGADARFSTPINTALLRLYDPNVTLQDTLDARTIPFSLAVPNHETQRGWYGPNHDIFITGTTMGASRLGEKNVSPQNLLGGLDEVTVSIGEKWQGSTARGFTLHSRNISIGGVVGGSIPVGAMSIPMSLSNANGTNESRLDYMDMNGDGYPDIITPHAIQYTNTTGGFSGETLSGIGSNSGECHSLAVSAGGSAEHAFSVGSRTGVTSTHAATNNLPAQSAKNGGMLLDIGLGYNSSDDHSDAAFVDINGDGLPDWITADGYVRLNMGYAFTPPVDMSMSLDAVQQTKGNQIAPNAGLSLPFNFNMAAGSFSAGVGVSTSNYNNQYDLIDVNGDGMPDKVYKDGSSIKVALNQGDNFDEEIVWPNMPGIRSSLATAESANTAATITFPITPNAPAIKLAINPGFGIGQGMSRSKLELRDIDGDGFIDILESDGENDLRVRRSTIRRTNRLRSVTNSLGGKFEIDYIHSTPTYGLPGGKWVMSTVTVDRGIHGIDYDIPNTRQTFDYARGVRDRHEREFLGFGKVTTWQVDPANNNAPLRQSVEVYDTTSIYTAGNLLQTYVASPQGNKCVKTENKYYKYSLTNDCENRGYNGGQFSFDSDNYHYWNDRGAAYCPMRFSETRRYEAESDSAIMSQDWYQYYDRMGDHGLVRYFRHSDKAGLSETGRGSYDYQTSVEYSYNLSDTAYIIGLPRRVKVADSRGYLYNLTEASYNLHHPNHITQIRRMLSYSSVTPVNGGSDIGPGRDDGGTAGTNGFGGAGGFDPGPISRYYPDQEPYTYVETYPNPVYATTDYSYDNYGNLLSTTLPMGADSTRVQYQYHHETTQNSYLSGIVDSYGLHSHSGEIDYRFGITNKQVDKNGAVYRTTNDNLGRMISVKSPLDSTNATPAMRFRYNPCATVTDGVITTPAYAVTVYYFPNTVLDNEVPIHYIDSMRVVTFVDGFGRPIQVRKDGVIWEGDENVGKTIVTGRTDYDGYGRAVRSYYPSTATDNTVGTYAAVAQKNEYYTTTVYDLLDREIAVTLPDNTTTSYQYGIDGNTTTTTIIDANGNASRTNTDGSGHMVKSVQYKGGVGAEALNTTFAYDGIGRLTTVTDTEGNATRSSYDLGNRRTEVTHPASGKTTFTYDALGNVLTRQTANLIGKGQYIRFTYEQGRLKRVTYPEHPENDVIYHYGDENAEQGLRGRVKFREDGSGGNEYHYDLLGNVNRMKRTVTVPGSMIATAEMTWNYDNFGKLKQMQFPRANGISERITYHYDRSGQLQSIYNGDLAGYHYVQEIGYDKFGERVHIKYGNGVKTTNEYYADNRRLYRKVTLSDSRLGIAGRMYNYDDVGNITSVSTISSNQLLPAINHTYAYDPLNRLIEAHGRSQGNSTLYDLNMTYDNMYRVTSKHQSIQQQNVQFAGKLFVGYNLDYNYNQVAGKKFQMSTVSDTNYRTALVAPTANDSIHEAHSYEYDNNGNILYVNILRLKPDMTAQSDTVQRTREEKFRWDEENRLTALSQNGYVSHYWYDADGERTVKMHGGSMAVFVNSVRDGRMLDMQPSTAYFSPYFSIQGNSFTKHLYIGSERVASMTGTLSPGDVSNSPAGGYNISHAGYDVGVTQLNIPYATKRDAMIDSAEANYAYFDLPNALEGQTRQTREFVLPAEDSDNAGNSVSGNDGSVGSGTGPRGDNTYYGNIWFIHADHLGSSTLVTDGNGGVSQQIEYLPYGEVLLEGQAGNYGTPYKFNGKELDEETGLYYYGARYMNPRLSIWYGTDPQQEDYPYVSTYTYTYCNPILIVDPNGESAKVSELIKNIGINITPFYSGVIDGVVEASPVGLITLIYDLSTDEQYREDAKKAINELYQHPIECLEHFVGNKIETYKSAINGHCSEDNQYEIGSDVGNIVGSVLMGGGFKKFIDILKNRRYSNVIYKVPGDATSSGKPYIGRTNDLRRRRIENRDGRDRTKAKVIGRYNPQKTKSGAIAEQNAMNKHGGVRNLDNKRNEIRESDWGKYKIKPVKKNK